jgi:hypothetical protein
MAAWLQFSMLMLTLVAFLLRNEHRITLVEEGLKQQKHINTLLWGQIDKLKDRARPSERDV